MERFIYIKAVSVYSVGVEGGGVERGGGLIPFLTTFESLKMGIHLNFFLSSSESNVFFASASLHRSFSLSL